MRKISWSILTLVAVIAMVCFTSCQDDDNSGAESIVAKVFMPQTTTSGGVVYNDYYVPLLGDPDSRHHIIDAETNTLKVILGVKQSGNTTDAFSVKVSADQDYSASLLSTISDGILLPEETYSLPEQVSVQGGENEAIFYLEIDLDKLAENYSEDFNKQLVVTVAISDPSKFEINKSRNRTVIIIDGRTFIPQSVQVVMPQASMLNGGVTNHYPVPFDATTVNYTFDEERGELIIPLGVSRNGEEPFDTFTVSVAADISHSNAQISSVENGVLLPADTYSLSSSNVTVKQGQTGATFNLIVDVNKLATDYAQYYKQKLVLTVRISNPTLYELNPELSQTVVIIDTKKFYPTPEAPNLVVGGQFNTGDEVNWTAINSDGGAGAGQGLKPDLASIRDGALKFTITSRCYHTFYQKITISEADLGQYKMSVLYKNSGSASVGGRVFVAFATVPPKNDQSYVHQNYMAARVENTVKNPYDGELLGTISQKFNGIDNEGKFNITAAGDYYFVLGVDVWSGVLTASFDDVKLQKLEE